MIEPGNRVLQTRIAEWLDKHTFPIPPGYPSEKLQTNLTSTRLREGIFIIQAAFGLFELEGAIDCNDQTLPLKNATLFIIAPGYQRFKVDGGINGNIKSGIERNVDAKKFAKGTIKIFLEADMRTVSMSWDLKVQFAGKLADKTYFFDVKNPSPSFQHDDRTLKKLDAYYSKGVDTLWRKETFRVISNGSHYHDIPAQELEQARKTALDNYNTALKLAERYVDDHYDTRTRNFLIKSYSSSDTYSLTLAFFEVFELVGAINAGETRSISVQLFVRVPILGRVELATIAGQLTKTGRVSTNIDCPIAEGTISVFLKGSVLYAAIDVKVMILGRFKNDEIELLPLPF